MNHVSGFTLVETLIALFLLTTGILLTVSLMHAGLRYNTDTDSQVRAVLAAEDKLEEMRAWSKEKLGATFNFHTNWTAYDGQQFTVPGASHLVMTTRIDRYSTVLTPCSSFELPWPDKRELDRSFVFAEVVVEKDGATLIKLVTLIGEPRRVFPAVGGLTISRTAGPGNPVPKDDSITLEGRAQDEDGQLVEDLLFRWQVEPETGQATATGQARDGSWYEVENFLLTPDGTRGHTGGQCLIKVQGRLAGEEKTESHVMVLEP